MGNRPGRPALRLSDPIERASASRDDHGSPGRRVARQQEYRRNDNLKDYSEWTRLRFKDGTRRLVLRKRAPRA